VGNEWLDFFASIRMSSISERAQIRVQHCHLSIVVERMHQQ
jgi:hypothetical protein